MGGELPNNVTQAESHNFTSVNDSIATERSPVIFLHFLREAEHENTKTKMEITICSLLSTNLSP